MREKKIIAISSRFFFSSTPWQLAIVQDPSSSTPSFPFLCLQRILPLHLSRPSPPTLDATVFPIFFAVIFFIFSSFHNFLGWAPLTVCLNQSYRFESLVDNLGQGSVHIN